MMRTEQAIDTPTDHTDIRSHLNLLELHHTRHPDQATGTISAHKGLSLIQTLICLLLVTSIALVATPTFSDMLKRNQARSAANLMQIRLQQVRSLAAQRGHIIAVCAGLEQCDQSTHWQNHLLIFEDRDGNGQRNGSEPILRQESLAVHHSWHWASFRRKPYLQMEPDGTTHALNGTLTLCQAGEPAYQVVVSLGGRPRLQPAPQAPSPCQ